MTDRRAMPLDPFVVREIIALSHTRYDGRLLGYKVVRSRDGVTIAQYYVQLDLLDADMVNATQKARRDAEKAVLGLLKSSSQHLPAKRK